LSMGTDPLTQLQELWQNPNGLKGFDLYPAPFDSQVLVAGGWRGPYLRLPPGGTELRDGWREPFTLQFPTASLPVFSAVSLGADKTVGGTGYNLDTNVTIPAASYLAGIAGNVKWLNAALTPAQIVNPDPANGTVVIKVYGPNPSDATGVGTI